jgi:hypothetical protein
MSWIKLKPTPTNILGAIVILVGLVGTVIALINSPAFAAKYFSADHNITSQGLEQLNRYRLILFLVGVMLIISGSVLIAKKGLQFKIDSLVLELGVVAWAILYILYLSTHKVPVNPAGFYLESARQLAANGYQIPAFVTGFGIKGIPFVYPPLGLYIYALVGKLLGSITTAALFIPGILLPIQAFSAYLFVKQFTGSNQAAQWAALFLLLTPQIFYRTIYGDGITTGLSGIFLLLSWYYAVKPTSRFNSVVGGLMVGLSILSHPGIGLFCAVTFTILFISQVRFTLSAIFRLFFSGIAALLIILPWLLPVISIHGLDPFLAGVKDSKSSLHMFENIGGTLSRIYIEHVGDQQEILAFLLFPPLLAMIYSVIRERSVILLLLLAGLFTFKGHPSVTMFVFALSIGIFYKDILNAVFGYQYPQSQEQKPDTNSPIMSWRFLSFALVYIGALFMLCIPYVRTPAFSPGEQEMYSWINTNTKPDSTFLIEEKDENLVYFGQRTILLPTLGAEWIPDPKYGNGLQRDRYIKNKVFACRELDCLINLFTEYSIVPDYMIFQISNPEEKIWIDKLGSSMFEVAFKSEQIVILRCQSCRSPLD